MKLITLEMLQFFKQKLEGLFVKKELKTGSTTEYKVLSDHNLTDELVEKINNASSASTVTESIATAKAEAITESNAYTDTEVADALVEAKAYADTAEADAVSSANAYADQKASDTLADAKSYTDTQVSATKTELTTAISTAKTEANAYTDNQVATAKTELTATINTKISTAYKIKGSTAFASLPTLSETEEGNVYNVTDAFTSTADFVEGASKKYPAGSNVVCIEESDGVFKWDGATCF